MWSEGATASLGVGEGYMTVEGRVTLAEERTLTSGVLVKEERCGD
jgi:hypothetical protein